MLAFHRGALSDRLAGCTDYSGSMMAVALPAEEVTAYLRSLGPEFLVNDVTIGCINSPRSVTLSGELNQLEALRSYFEKIGVFARLLKVPVAYHSPQMSTIASEYESLIQNIDQGDTQPAKATMMISSVTGTKVLAKTLLDPQYWVSNLASPVRFSQALSRMAESVNTLLEIGPHSTLKGPVQETLESTSQRESVAYISLLARGMPAVPCVLKAMGNLYCAGYPINITRVNNVEDSGQFHHTTPRSLPEYPFDHSNSYWEESRISKGFRFRKHRPHDLLGTPVSDWNPLEPRWRLMAKLEKLPFIEDHKVSLTCQNVAEKY